MPSGGNDGEALLHALEGAAAAGGVPALLSRLRGPWALAFYSRPTHTLWVGRDAVGRRSLLLHRPCSLCDPRLLITSVAPPSELSDGSAGAAPAREDGEEEEQAGAASPAPEGGFWEELAPGLHSCSLAGDAAAGHVWQRHAWQDAELEAICEQTRPEPPPEPPPLDDRPLDDGGCLPEDRRAAADAVLAALRASLADRTQHCQGLDAPTPESLPLAVLFSGGLDSMLVACLAGEAMLARSQSPTIDLLSVCFDGGRSPDRLTARAGLEELAALHAGVRWRLVEIDSSLAEVDAMRPRLLALLAPRASYMDLNVGAALWLAARGAGRLLRPGESAASGDEYYVSPAKVVLSGAGADEQAGGYGRHRSAFLHRGGWPAMQASPGQ